MPFALSTTIDTSVTLNTQASLADGIGGMIETSGYSLKAFGVINAGNKGSWLIDPTDIVIDSTLSTSINTTLNSGGNVTAVSYTHLTLPTNREV